MQLTAASSFVGAFEQLPVLHDWPEVAAERSKTLTHNYDEPLEPLNELLTARLMSITNGFEY